jgi:beta-galactosidase GanA
LKDWQKKSIPGPAFHRGTFTLASVTDTYLDVSMLGKGFVWVNGHNLGRTWGIGPQQSLYLPAPWLQKGANEVVVFDYTDLGTPQLRGVVNPIWSDKKQKMQAQQNKHESQDARFMPPWVGEAGGQLTRNKQPCCRTKQQVPPLRCAPVGMTNSFEIEDFGR